MFSNKDVNKFLDRNPALCVSILEKEVALPSTTLSKAIAGKRTLLSSIWPLCLRFGKKYGLLSGSQRQARVLSIINHKARVGKTTTAVRSAFGVKGFSG